MRQVEVHRDTIDALQGEQRPGAQRDEHVADKQVEPNRREQRLQVERR